MSSERVQPASDQAKYLKGDTARQIEPTEHLSTSDSNVLRSKLSVNVDHDISERLRSLAYTHRLSESSIVEVALTMFFARGDDALLGMMLKELGAKLRRR